MHFPYESDSPDGPYVTGAFLEVDGARLDIGWYAAPVVCDWNGDGKPDLLVGQGGCVIYFENVGTAQAWKLEGRVTIAAADWDGDGEIEIFASWSSGDIKLFKQSAAGWKGTDISTSWIPYPHPIVIDVTGSGAPGLILSGSYGFVHLFRRAFVEQGYNEGRVTSGA